MQFLVLPASNKTNKTWIMLMKNTFKRARLFINVPISVWCSKTHIANELRDLFLHIALKPPLTVLLTFISLRVWPDSSRMHTLSLQVKFLCEKSQENIMLISHGYNLQNKSHERKKKVHGEMQKKKITWKYFKMNYNIRKKNAIC